MQLFNKDIYQSFIASFQLVYRAAPRHTVAGVIPAVIGSVFPLVTVYLIKLVIDETTEAVNAADKSQAFARVLLWVVLTGVVFLVNTLAEALNEYLQETRSQLFFDYIHDKIHQKTTGLDLEFFENDKYYDLFTQALNNAHIKPLNIVNNTFSFFQNTAALLTLGALLLTLHWSVFFVLFLASVPLGLVKLKFSNDLYRRYKSQIKNERKTWDINDVLTNEYFAAEVRLFRISSYLKQLFSSVRSEIRTGYITLFRKRLAYESAAQLIAALAVFGAFAFIARQAVYGILTIGALTMYFVAIQKGTGLFTGIFQSITGLYEDSLYVVHLTAFLNLQNRSFGQNRTRSFPKQLREGIKFENVSFKYPDSARSALQNVNLYIKPGSTVALVGTNGAGKSTIIKLLCGFYTPDSGRITADGTALTEIKTEELRAQFSTLFQRFARYNFTARENIGFGNPTVNFNDEKVKEAAQKAGIHDVLENLPNGYDTILGKIYEDSEELSTVQWQKIGLARAFYKDSPVIILDEPTASLDAETEYELFKRFQELTRDKTSIIVSHRFSTVKQADYIYVINDKTVQEQGTHKELIAQNGLYAAMFNKQAQSYH